jgi:hypothetical protein
MKARPKRSASALTARGWVIMIWCHYLLSHTATRRSRSRRASNCLMHRADERPWAPVAAAAGPLHFVPSLQNAQRPQRPSSACCASGRADLVGKPCRLLRSCHAFRRFGSIGNSSRRSRQAASALIHHRRSSGSTALASFDVQHFRPI